MTYWAPKEINFSFKQYKKTQKRKHDPWSLLGQKTNQILRPKPHSWAERPQQYVQVNHASPQAHLVSVDCTHSTLQHRTQLWQQPAASWKHNVKSFTCLSLFIPPNNRKRWCYCHSRLPPEITGAWRSQQTRVVMTTQLVNHTAMPPTQALCITTPKLHYSMYQEIF